MSNFFLMDHAFDKRTIKSFDENEVNSGYGYPTKKVLSYFNNVIAIPDTRVARTTVASVAPDYRATLLTSTIQGGFDWDTLTDAEKDKIFNIIDLLFLEQGVTNNDLETTITSNNSIYGAYVPASLKRSANFESKSFYHDPSDTIETVLSVPQSIEFKYSFSGTQFTFAIWLSEAAFLLEFPETVITEVILPIDANQIVNPTTNNPITTQNNTAKAMLTTLENSVEDYDNTSVSVFTSRYTIDGSSSNNEMTFGLTYKGKEPNTATIRTAIKDELLATNLATEDQWRAILPDLFIDGQYFILPHYPSINGDFANASVNIKVLKDFATNLLTTFDPSDIDKIEVVMSSASDLYLVGVVGKENDSEFQSFLDEHPTYQHIDGSDPRFQDQAFHTRNFSVRFSNCIAKALGRPNSAVFVEETIEGRNYYSFVENFKEYHVLKQESSI